MGVVEADVDVDVPARIAYDQWTQFESFPRFSSLVKRVEQVQPAVTRWLVGIGPVRREFHVEVREQHPHSLVAWRNLGRHLRHDGEASFVPRSEDHATVRVTVRLESSERLLGRLVHAVARRVIRAELARFKSFVEGVGGAVEMPRGTIRNGRVLSSETQSSTHPGWVHG
ncbi:cyclase [Pseudoclavibacter endophyticus]|uniref:Cyclase n=1 Tax=Pseudoclavibacter endophyticus TaxID=1778590 RepID=A0A6H9WK55_9MICO|nr:SRPBCC family protein [Pseudoclavibacter endophyticus]KAB1649246.1 cyclase [Pseudoclavibacter endophyticus]GGA64146.1 cyclase [Pseudoclavibacter endophyticus]